MHDRHDRAARGPATTARARRAAAVATAATVAAGVLASVAGGSGWRVPHPSDAPVPTGTVTATLAVSATAAAGATPTETISAAATVVPTPTMEVPITATVAATSTVAISTTPTAIPTPTLAVSTTVTAVATPTPAISITPTAILTPTPAISTTATSIATPTLAVSTTPTTVATPTLAVSTTATSVATPTLVVSTTATAVTTPTLAVLTTPTAVATPTLAVLTTPTAVATPTSVISTTPGPTRAPAPTATRGVRRAYLPYLTRSAEFAAPRPRVWGTQFVMEHSGTHHADDVAIELPRVYAAGMRSIRAAIRWDWIEPENTTPDLYDWRHADQLLGDYSAAGFDVLVMLVGYPAWATEYGCGGGLRPGMEREWREFTRALAVRYGRPPYHIAAWEIGNEVDGSLIVDDDDHARPPGWGPGEPTTPYGGCWAGLEPEYKAFLAAAYTSIKIVTPKVLVTHGGLAYVDSFKYGLGGFDIRFLDRLLAAGGGRYFDFFNYHWFLDYPFQPPGPERHRQAVATLARHGFVKPVWITETYRVTQPEVPDTYVTQVRFLTQEILPMLALPDVERIYWYGWVDYPPDVADQRGQGQRGLVDGLHRPKPGLAVLPHIIRHTNGIGTDRSTKRISAWQFTWPRSGETHVVAWSANGKAVQWQVPEAPGRRATVRSFSFARVMAGQCCAERTLPVDDGRLVLDLGVDPVFAEIGGP